MRNIFLASVLFLLQIEATFAANQQQLDQATSVVERLCLSGKGFSLRADISGNVSFIKISPGVDGKVNVDAKKTSGAVGYLNEEIRRIADEDTRRCMSPHIDKIIQMIRESDKKRQENFSVFGSNVNFGCEKGATSSVSYEPPPGYKILNAYVEPQDISNAKEIHPSIVKSDKKATASIYFHGKDREFMNCPGGGHGRTRLYGTIVQE